ncbi:FMRFamide receptor [Plakobranchus ocellatus]|uniref:FMRFamide receptor n=1 Tax=Plakobranchus ocellatus TaxID=259542 RepID=A0AAV4A9S9_9GAST|nr:FMRFamide receptor [Plakobranchus ocellatus]
MVSPLVIQFSFAYRPIFEVVCPALCIVGIVTNCFNILVLSKQKMKSPTNVLLQWLAAADGLGMISHLIYNIHYPYLDKYKTGAFSTKQIMNVSMVVAVLFHSIAIWLAVALAMFRSLVVSFPLHAGRLCTFSRVYITAGIISILMVVAAVPNMCINTIQGYNLTAADNTTITRYYFGARSRNLDNFNRILHSVACRLLPCLLLLILNAVLIQGMIHAKRRHLELTSASSSTSQQSGRSASTDGNSSSTVILVAIVTLSILTETPHGVILFWIPFDQDVKLVYNCMGDLIDTLTILNSGVNFFLYCTMSKKFRKSLINMMRKAVKPGLWFTRKSNSR